MHFYMFQEIDGDSFLLLQQSDLMNFLNIKLGPAVKIFNSILVLKNKAAAGLSWLIEKLGIIFVIFGAKYILDM